MNEILSPGRVPAAAACIYQEIHNYQVLRLGIEISLVAYLLDCRRIRQPIDYNIVGIFTTQQTHTPQQQLLGEALFIIFSSARPFDDITQQHTPGNMQNNNIGAAKEKLTFVPSAL